jgi:RecA/RadA recombinase
MDLVLGGKKGALGFPAGVIINLIGDRSAGKSFLKNEIMANGYHTYGPRFKWFNDDTESGDTFDTSDLYGVDLRPQGRLIGEMPADEDSKTVEEFDARLTTFVNSMGPDDVGLYAIDSLDGLTSRNQELESENRAAEYQKGKEAEGSGGYHMEKQKFLSSEFFASQHARLEQKNCSLIIVSQIRDKMTTMPSYGDNYSVSGGKALPFYCHSRVFLKAKNRFVVRDRPIGYLVEAKTIKSKTKRPFRKCQFIVYYDYGIDDIGSSIDFLFDLRNDRGQLDANKASNLLWGTPGEGGAPIPYKMETAKEWLEGIGRFDEVKALCKEHPEFKSTVTFKVLSAVIEGNEELKALQATHFGVQLARGALIELCERDPEQKKILDERVIAKWEAEEDAIATKRPNKYASSHFSVDDELAQYEEAE